MQRSIPPSTNSFPPNIADEIDLIVNGSFWLGAAAGALASPFLLDQHLFPVNLGWRLGFGIGAMLGLSILCSGGSYPKVRRWLVTHCRNEEAEETVKQIEADVIRSTGRNLPPVNSSLEVHPRKVFGIGLILTSMLGRYRQRSISRWYSWSRNLFYTIRSSLRSA